MTDMFTAPDTGPETIAEMLKDAVLDNLAVWPTWEQRLAGARFIAWSREAVPALAAERDMLREALQGIARQKLPEELRGDEDYPDFEGGYDAIVKLARVALGEKK